VSEAFDPQGGYPPGYPPMDPAHGLEVSDGGEVKLAEGEKLTPQHVLDALKPIKDPEIFLSIVDLGLIYGVDVSEDRAKVTVKMTLTGPGCPVGPQILAAVHNTVARIPGVSEPDVQLVWDPPWNPVIHASDDAKDALGIW
jgi:metal-sulfur cluster biosynthetic enzyme